MGKLRLLTVAMLSGLMISGSALATNVIDQNQDAGPITLVVFSQPNLAQAFQQSAGDISGAGIFLSANGLGPVEVTISLWDALPNQNGTQLATARDTTYANSHWMDVFWDPVAISANHTYYLVFKATNLNYGIAGSVSNPYSRGAAYANAGFSNLPVYDFTFRTYADDSFVPPVQGVPEPAAWALMIAGFGLSGAALRRRRATVVRA